MPGLLSTSVGLPQPLQPSPGAPLPALGTLQQQQQLIQLLQQQPQLLQQQPQLLQAIAQPQLLQQQPQLLQALAQPQLLQPQLRQGATTLPGLVPLFPPPQSQQQPQLPPQQQPNLPPLLAGLPGLGLAGSSAHLQPHLQPQQPPQQQTAGTGLEGLPAEAVNALREAAKALLPQPFRWGSACCVCCLLERGPWLVCVRTPVTAWGGV